MTYKYAVVAVNKKKPIFGFFCKTETYNYLANFR